MADRRQGATRAGVRAAALALLLSGAVMAVAGHDGGPGLAPPSPPPPTAVQAAAHTAPETAEPPPFGAFTDSGAAGVRALGALRSWLGGTPVRVGHTYLPGDTWAGIEGRDDLLQPWADWTRAATGRLFVLNVPMQEDDGRARTDAQVRALIRQGADGRYDAHFTALARRLVDLGLPDTVVVLGWEMNGVTYAHRCGPDPQGWKAYWKRIVAAMRAVPGQHFRFDFAPSRGRDDVPWTTCYPGDASVDVIGMDSYDQPAGASFHEQVAEPYGLQRQVDFAKAHKKAISYPEWGLFTNGDDPGYVSGMLAWFAAHRPLYQTLTDYCPHGVRECAANPESAKVYRDRLSGRGPAPAPPSGAAEAAGPS